MTELSSWDRDRVSCKACSIYFLTLRECLLLWAYGTFFVPRIWALWAYTVSLRLISWLRWFSQDPNHLKKKSHWMEYLVTHTSELWANSPFSDVFLYFWQHSCHLLCDKLLRWKLSEGSLWCARRQRLFKHLRHLLVSNPRGLQATGFSILQARLAFVLLACVLVFLLLWRDTMTTSTLIKENS